MLETALQQPIFSSEHQPVEWQVSSGLTSYPQAMTRMERRVKAIINGSAPEMVWLLEHPPLYTAGTSAKASGLLNAKRFPIFESGRGGQYTYHGPGQRIAYVMLDLRKRGQDVRAFVQALEDWLIATLKEFQIHGEKRCDRVGVWVKRLDNGGVREDKIGALGIRLRKWVSLHGIALNVHPDLTHYDGIIPCGVREHGVTSLADLGIHVAMQDVDSALKRNFQKIFG